MNPKLFLPLLAAGLAVIVGLLFGPTQPSAQPIVSDVQVIESNAGPGYVPQDGLQDREDCPCGPNCNCGSDCPCRKSNASKSQAGVVDPLTGRTVYGPTIIPLSTPGCSGCIVWDRDERPKFAGVGWTVDETHYGASVPSYPSARVWTGKRWYTHVGYLNASAMRAIQVRDQQSPQHQATGVSRRVVPQQMQVFRGNCASGNCSPVTGIRGWFRR